MNEKQVQIEALLTLADAAEITKYISPQKLAEIKKHDDNPVFAMMTVGCEGESTGELYNSGLDKLSKEAWYKQLWPLKAVKQLISKLTEKEVPVYAHQHQVKGYDSRPVLGRIVASTKKVIDNVTHALSIAYMTDIPTITQLRKGELNSCSMEAKCIFSKAEETANWVVEVVKEITGVVLFNNKVIKPGFEQASIHAVLMAMSAQDEKGKNMEITLEDVKKYIEEKGIKPSSLFSVETLTKDGKVKDAIDNEIKVATAAKDTEIATLQKEMKPLKALSQKAMTQDLISKSELLKNEGKGVVNYLKRIIKVNSETITQSVIDEEIKEQLQVIKDMKLKFEDVEDKEKQKDGNLGKEKDDDGKGGTEDENKEKDINSSDVTLPQNNPLIPK